MMKSGMAVTAQNTFGLKLLSQVAAERRHENVIVSPLSVFLALGMVELGAAGQTRAAIRQALEVPPDLDEEELCASIAALARTLPRESSELTIANALWSDHQTPLATDFVARCRELYDAEAITLDFLSPDAAEVINSWVRKQTRGKIESIVSPRMVAASKAILTNALYFKGAWRWPFAAHLTQDMPFHLVDKTQEIVPMMWQPALTDAYRSGVGYEAVVLPYESAETKSDIVLCAILPEPGTSPEDILMRIPLAMLLSAYQPVELDLHLPMVTVHFDASLKSALIRMGMGIAFEYPLADFAAMGSPEFFIGDVLHRTRVDVDEEGTVAAAVTAILAPMGMPKPRSLEKKTLVFDRPFALLLCDQETGALLFAGTVYQPSREPSMDSLQSSAGGKP